MDKAELSKALEVMTVRFGHDTLLSLATLEGNVPAVRIVDSYYENGSFYTVTYALSNKMKQIEANSTVAVCGEWFTAHGVGENMGYVCEERNSEIATKLRQAFSTWYTNGHVDESDPNTVILRIKLTDGVLYDQSTRYDIDFNNLQP